MSDFFDVHSGLAGPFKKRSTWFRRMLDSLYDTGLSAGGGKKRIREIAARQAPQRILIVGVEVPSRPTHIHDVMKRLQAGTRHETRVSVVPMGERGKFENIDKAISEAPEALDGFDWLIAVDDDISFAPTFLDDLIALAAAADLAIAQPAHAFESHTSYTITRRKRGSLVRQTAFVEIGPLTLIRADAFDTYIPFPASRWCYGIDVLWSELAEQHGHRMGIVDGAPVRHLRPIASSYGMDAAVAEGRELLTRLQVKRRREDLWKARVVVPAQVAAADRSE